MKSYYIPPNTNEKKVKAFKRLLKMTGLYSLWMTNRKNEFIRGGYYCDKKQMKDMFEFINRPSMDDADKILHNSFEWVNTERLSYGFWESLEKIFSQYVNIDTFPEDNNRPKFEKMIKEINDLKKFHMDKPKTYGY